MKQKKFTVLLVIFFFAGLSLLLYPTISNWWNERVQTKAIASYVEAMEDFSAEEFAALINEAREYNKGLLNNELGRYKLDAAKKQRYNSILNATGNGIIGYIEIPTIKVTLAIYHGTDESVLQTGVGHIEGTSFPVGGIGTHCALSGHRGLPSAKLFTNLDRLGIGDIFIIRTLNEVFTYQVDDISIVLPHQLDKLTIYKDRDLCTLVTCTPYGINSHRLLVRGTRIENEEAAKSVFVTSEAFRLDSLLLAPLIGIPLLVILLFSLNLRSKKRRKRNDFKNEP